MSYVKYTPREARIFKWKLLLFTLPNINQIQTVNVESS